MSDKTSPAIRLSPTPPVQIILQARVDSVRLPGKALMPLGGRPSAILAAQRAARGTHPLLLATSQAPSCDALAAAGDAAGLKIFRGDDQDVLGRFADAAADLSDDAILVRLTGDNVFPDADFADQLVEALRGSDAEIVGSSSAKGLPYGLSGEAFRLVALRRAAAAAITPYDREHVTPWIYRHAKTGALKSLDGAMDLADLRCTLDVAEDYRILTRVFEDVPDPVGIGWRDLVTRLTAICRAGNVSP